MSSKFYKLTSDITKVLRKKKLTAAEWRVWSYLVEIDPFGDRYCDLDLLALLTECDVSKATFYRAIAKLQEAELFDIQAEVFSVRNLRGVTSLISETPVSEMRLESQICDNSLRNETTVSEMRLDSHSCDSQGLEPLHQLDSTIPQTIQTLKTFQTPSEAGWEELKIFSEKLKVIGVHVVKSSGGGWSGMNWVEPEFVNNPQLKNIAKFLGENSEELRSPAIQHFLKWISSQKNIRDIYAAFYVSLKNFFEAKI